MKRVNMLVWIFGLLIVGISGNCWCSTEDSTAELEHAKLLVSDATTIDLGHFEMEIGYSLTSATKAWDWNRKSDSRPLLQEKALELAFAYSPIENMDVAAGWSVTNLLDRSFDFDPLDAVDGPQDGTGIGDLELSGRWRFHSSDKYGDIALLTDLALPTGKESDAEKLGPGQGYWSMRWALAFSKDWAPFTLNAEQAFTLPFGSERGDARAVIETGLALGWQAYPWFQPALEMVYGGEMMESAYADGIVASLGFIMPASDHLRAAVGVQGTLTGRDADRAVSAVFALTYMR